MPAHTARRLTTVALAAAIVATTAATTATLRRQLNRAQAATRRAHAAANAAIIERDALIAYVTLRYESRNPVGKAEGQMAG